MFYIFPTVNKSYKKTKTNNELTSPAWVAKDCLKEQPGAWPPQTHKGFVKKHIEILNLYLYFVDFFNRNATFIQ